MLMGLWHVVCRTVMRMPTGPKRPTTMLWHLPLVRFADDDAVDLTSLFAFEPSMGDLTPFVTANWTLVACKNGWEEARLAAACSLPSDVFTEPDVWALQRRLAALRCGMRDRHRKYWNDILYQHHVREIIEETAVRIASRELADQGWIVDESKQVIGGWGGDLDCERRNKHGLDEKLCVEVKGTRYQRWLGRVVLQVSQRERAVRTAAGTPLPSEAGYDWQLRVQPGVPPTHTPARDAQLPAQVIRDAAWVATNWDTAWVK